MLTKKEFTLEFVNAGEDLTAVTQEADFEKVYVDIESELDALQDDVFQVDTSWDDFSYEPFEELLNGHFVIDTNEFEDLTDPTNEYYIYYKDFDDRYYKLAKAEYDAKGRPTNKLSSFIVDIIYKRVIQKILSKREELLQSKKTGLTENSEEIKVIETEIKNVNNELDKMSAYETATKVIVLDEYKKALDEHLSNNNEIQDSEIETLLESVKNLSNVPETQFVDYEKQLEAKGRFCQQQAETRKENSELKSKYKEYAKQIESATKSLYETYVESVKTRAANAKTFSSIDLASQEVERARTYLSKKRTQIDQSEPAFASVLEQYEQQMKTVAEEIQKKKIDILTTSVEGQMPNLELETYQGPLTLQEIETGLVRVAEALSNVTSGSGEEQQLKQLQIKLTQLKEQLAEKVDDEQVAGLTKQLTDQIAARRTGILSNQDLTVVQLESFLGKKETKGKDKGKVLEEGLIDKYVAGIQTKYDTFVASGSVSPEKKLALESAFRQFARFKEEVAMRIDLIRLEQEIRDLTDKIEAKAAKKGDINENQARRWQARLTKAQNEREQILAKLAGYSSLSGGSIDLSKESPAITDMELAGDITLPESLSTSVEVDGTTAQVNSPEQLDALFAGKLNENQRLNLRSAATEGLTLLQLQQKGLNENEIKYLIAYKKLVYNKNNRSRADVVKKLVNLDKRFNNKHIGKISDFRQLAKEVKRAAKKEKKKFKYAREAFKYMVAFSMLDAANKVSLLEITHLGANGISMPDMQLMPTFWKNGQIDVRSSAPYNLSEVAYTFFGERRQTEVQSILGEDVFPNLPFSYAGGNVPPLYTFPQNVGPTSIVERQGTGGSYEQEFTPEGGVLSERTQMEDNQVFYKFWYLYQAETKDLNSFEMTAIAPYARECIKRWLNPAKSFDLFNEVKAKLGTNDTNEVLNVIDDMMTHAITPDVATDVRRQYLMNAGSEEVVTSDKRWRLYSQGLVKGLIKAYGNPGWEENIKARLATLCGGNRDNEMTNVNAGAEKQSNLAVGQKAENRVGLTMGATYLTAPRNAQDLSPVDHGYYLGVNRAAENLAAAAVHYAGVDPKYAKLISGTTKLGLTVGAIVGAFYFGRRALGLNPGHQGGRTGRFLKIGGLLAISNIALPLLMGKSGMELLNGARGGMKLDGFGGVAGDALTDRLGNPEKADLTKKQKLNFLFGDLTISHLMQLIKVDNAGKFALKEGAYRQILIGSGLDPNQKADLESLRASLGEGGINEIINGGLIDAGITPINKDEKIRDFGNRKLSEYLADQVTIGGYRQQLADALGVDVNDSLIAALEAEYIRLSDIEKPLFIERLQKSAEFTRKYNAGAAYISSHLLVHRQDLMSAIGRSAQQISGLQAGFARSSDIQNQLQMFMLGQSPYDKTQPTVTNYATLESAVTGYFGANGGPLFQALVLDPNAENQLFALEITSGLSDEKVKIDYDSSREWYLNRPAGGSQSRQYKEALFEIGGKKVFIGVEEPTSPATIPGSSLQQSFLTFWIPSGDGTWRKWKLENIDSVPMYINGAGRATVGGVSKFLLSAFDSGSGAYVNSQSFAADFFKSIVTNASQGRETFQLTGSDLDDATNSALLNKNVKLQKTTDMRP